MQEHLIIDGNNALHAIPQLAKTLERDRQMARDDLVRMLEPLQARENYLLTVVFDGRGGKTALTNIVETSNTQSFILHPLRVPTE